MAILKMTAILAAALLGTASAVKPASVHVEVARNDPTPANLTHVICKPPTFGWSPTPELLEGIAYLRGKDGYTEFGWQQGGGYCTRVSCEEDSGIYVCNDNEFPIWVYYDVMADYAQYILNFNDTGGQTACTWMESNVDQSGMSMEVAWGQAFDVNGFNIVVGMAEWTSC